MKTPQFSGFKVSFKWLADERLWGYGLFWSWNLIFLAFMTLGFAPLLLPDMIRSVREGLTPPIYLVYLLVLTGIPALAALLGLTWLRRYPGKLLALGYGIEGPLMLLFLLRIFVIRDATPIANAITLVAGIGLAAFLWVVLDTRSDPPTHQAQETRSRRREIILGYLRISGLALVMLLGLYAAILIAFYVVPILAQTPSLLSTSAEACGMPSVT